MLTEYKRLLHSSKLMAISSKWLLSAINQSLSTSDAVNQPVRAQITAIDIVSVEERKSGNASPLTLLSYQYGFEDIAHVRTRVEP